MRVAESLKDSGACMEVLTVHWTLETGLAGLGDLRLSAVAGSLTQPSPFVITSQRSTVHARESGASHRLHPVCSLGKVHGIPSSHFLSR